MLQETGHSAAVKWYKQKAYIIYEHSKTLQATRSVANFCRTCNHKQRCQVLLDVHQLHLGLDVAAEYTICYDKPKDKA